MSKIRLKRKRREEAFMKNEYIKKYSLSDKKFCVKCLESVNYNSQIINKKLVIWVQDGFINDGDEEKYIFFDRNFYDFLMHSIPNKEINHKLKNKTNVSENSKVEELRQLGELREKGIINQDEFEKLKRNLID